jgi:hypothetical protein
MLVAHNQNQAWLFSARDPSVREILPLRSRESAMERRSGQVSALSTDVLMEAKRATGTWSLATYSRITGTLVTLPAADVRLFLTKIVEQLLTDETPTSERYKLAQICTMCRQKFYPGVADVLALYHSPILALIDALGDDPLAPAVASLLRSLVDAQQPHQNKRRIRDVQSDSVVKFRPNKSCPLLL